MGFIPLDIYHLMEYSFFSHSLGQKRSSLRRAQLDFVQTFYDSRSVRKINLTLSNGIHITNI